MVRVKSEAEIKKNYEDSTTLVRTRYEAGVRAATWQSEAIAGQALYEEQMRREEILRRRRTGIERVDDSAWRSAAIDKGGGVISARMKAASDKQVQRFRPYREALAALDLPARTTDPMQNLINRAGAVVQAMVKTKEAQG